VRLASDDDEVVGMICLENDQYEILVVSENGYGKRSALEDYRVTNRGGKGVKTMNITEKTGNLIAIKNVTDLDDLMIINKSGVLIRLGVAELRIVGRATQGVRLINIREGDAIAAVTKVEVEEEILDETSEISDNDVIILDEFESSDEIVEKNDDSIENEDTENLDK
jgi:DNA gyrase subunit A